VTFSSFSLFGIALLVGFSVWSGCETTFDPFEDSDLAFSLFGYLDASTDTQYVRVGALRQSAFEETALDASVRLVDVRRGETVLLRDSLFRFSNGAVAHNFWTTYPIRAGETYRVEAVRADGVASSAIVRVPAPFPLPELEAGITLYSSPQFPPQAQSMVFFAIERFADLRIDYVLDDPDLTVTIPYLGRLSQTPSGQYFLAFNAYADVQKAVSGVAGSDACPALRRARVFIAAATPDWPEVLAFDPETQALPSVASNVANGLGYVGGVITLEGIWPAMNAVFGFHREGCLSR
jgi:hypothetical protein